MAATVSPWGKAGAWALDSEEHEDELLQQQQDDKVNGEFSGGEGRQAPEASADFPTLATAAATKSKKKKGQTLSLSEFSAFGAGKSAQPSQTKGLTHEDLMMLPTGPRQRSAEELDRGRLGGGFRSYGSNGSYEGGRSRYGGGEDSANPRWGSRGSEERRQGGFGRDSSRELAPSRADEIDDWGAAKKSTVGNGFERRDRGGFFDSQSRADESASWVSNKSFTPSEGRRFGGGGGFESLRERRGGFDSASDGGGGADSESWGRKKEEGSGNANGSAGSRPKLILQPRTVPVNDGQQPGSGSVAKPKGPNPFGEARPREEVLAEKGQDWKEIEEKLESVKLKDVGSPGVGQTDGPSFGKRSFGSGNARASLPESRTEKSWRKPESEDVRAAKTEDEHEEKTQD
ncbi:eukaryotic translation initiation factor 4B3-like [Vitis riparia]|uniref:eukaryotic translation initiation factor 4B3-like n=1 Tax=Vitis riparia TaxID=96939 RepID=UPI00155B160F|nr:eukaryotic translation initiation factor 4B3-like [Vitis riparia]